MKMSVQSRDALPTAYSPLAMVVIFVTPTFSFLDSNNMRTFTA